MKARTAAVLRLLAVHLQELEAPDRRPHADTTPGPPAGADGPNFGVDVSAPDGTQWKSASFPNFSASR
jgi:hypothetical protein